MPAKSKSDATRTFDCAARLGFNPVQCVEPAEKSHLNRATTIYECFQIIALSMHQGIWIRRIQVAKKGQPRT
jgi:hypothetical protein